ncbi:MAG: twin-arginine translocase TatA/TatE family subunit [Chitinophagales bacterium]
MNTLLLFGIPGGPELILILVVILLLFGGKKIPELARGIGKGIKEFNNAKASIQQEIDEGMKIEETKKDK